MNRVLFSKVAVAALGMVAMMPSAAFAEDGRINIDGEVITSTCSLNGGTAGGPFAPITVSLPKVSKTSVTGSGAGRTPFSIAVTGCAANQAVLVGFENDPVFVNQGNGALLNAGTVVGTRAAGVEVQLINAKDQAAIVITAGTGAQKVTPVTMNAAGGGSLDFMAQYIPNGTAITAGKVSAVAKYTLQYP
jgi:major type 1 subunit fimbrin (pilin)